MAPLEVRYEPGAVGISLYDAHGAVVADVWVRNAVDEPAVLALAHTMAAAEMLRTIVTRFCETSQEIEREWDDDSITSEGMAFLLNCLIRDGKKARAALSASNALKTSPADPGEKGEASS